MILQEFMPLIWFGIIAFGIFMYVLMDGFVLGIGILSRFAHNEEERDIMMNSVAPVWDGNETWLVLGGAGLFGAFPVAYSTVLPALYLPLLLMLIALVFRGVAFEFRFKAERSKFLWNAAFHWGSVIATFAQGVSLGGFVQGFAVSEQRFVGGTLDFLSPFSLLVGVALVSGYALLGATWMIIKTEAPLQDRARMMSRRLTLAVLGFILLISLAVPFLEADYGERWFSWPNILFLSPVPLLVLADAYYLRRCVDNGHEGWPFILAMGLFLLGYAGLAISIWPNIVPPAISFREAAAPLVSQGFMLVGMSFVIPTVLAYTAYSYWIFRGKIRADEGYH